jgi:hypothetical protein
MNHATFGADQKYASHARAPGNGDEPPKQVEISIVRMHKLLWTFCHFNFCHLHKTGSCKHVCMQMLQKEEKICSKNGEMNTKTLEYDLRNMLLTSVLKTPGCKAGAYGKSNVVLQLQPRPMPTTRTLSFSPCDSLGEKTMLTLNEDSRNQRATSCLESKSD